MITIDIKNAREVAQREAKVKMMLALLSDDRIKHEVEQEVAKRLAAELVSRGVEAEVIVRSDGHDPISV